MRQSGAFVFQEKIAILLQNIIQTEYIVCGIENIVIIQGTTEDYRKVF